MNREELERKLLLEESGELGADDARALAAWIAAHPEAAALRGDMRHLLTASRAALPSPEPGAAVRARLRAAAAGAPARPALMFPAVMLRGLACAAAVALAVSGWLWMTPPRTHEDRIAQVHAMVSSMAADEEPMPAALAADDRDEQLRALAQALLSMEGLAMEEATEYADEGAFDKATPTEELSPTALRPRNAPGFAARTCG